MQKTILDSEFFYTTDYYTPSLNKTNNRSDLANQVPLLMGNITYVLDDGLNNKTI